ncbi:MAG: hypothetical protein U5L06_10720 [Rhodovibrio sp.]|nr:hypothetical protein [Rhodovibrio sp.]
MTMACRTNASTTATTTRAARFDRLSAMWKEYSPTANSMVTTSPPSSSARSLAYHGLIGSPASVKAAYCTPTSSTAIAAASIKAKM